MIVGRGDGEQFVASAVPAFMAHTREVQYIDNDELVVLRRDGVELIKPDGTVLDRPIVHIDWDEETAEKGGFETFMLKEMHEQADALADTIFDRTAAATGSTSTRRTPWTRRCWATSSASSSSLVARRFMPG